MKGIRRNTHDENGNYRNLPEWKHYTSSAVHFFESDRVLSFTEAFRGLLKYNAEFYPDVEIETLEDFATETIKALEAGLLEMVDLD